MKYTFFVLFLISSNLFADVGGNLMRTPASADDFNVDVIHDKSFITVGHRVIDSKNGVICFFGAGDERSVSCLPLVKPPKK